MYSLFVREMKRHGLEDGPQLQCKCSWRKDIKTLEQGKVKGFEVSKDQIPGEGCYANPQSQAIYNKHTMTKCHKAVLSA